MRPNLLFVLTDQQHRYSLGCMGNPNAQTPNLDAFAQEGALFTNSYTACPICTAARINFFTGQYATQTNSIGNCQPIPANTPTLASCFNQAGYQTAFVGKWHIGDMGNKPIPRQLQGDFQEFDGYQCYNGFLENVRFYDQDENETLYTEHRTTVTTKRLLAKIKKFAAVKKPFAIAASYQAPHYPVEPAPEFAKQHTAKPLTFRQNVDPGTEPYTKTWSPPSPRPPENDPNYQKYGGNLRVYTQLYNAMVSQIDAAWGELLRQLKDLGLYENTVIVFTSDHGDMQGSHGLVNKCLPHEESAGIPLIVRAPQGARGRVENAPVGGVDFMPTCLELCGLADKIPATVSGQSFAAACHGKLQNAPPVFSEFAEWLMVRRDNFKLVVDKPSGQPTAFYDLAADEYEMTNLCGQEKYAAEINELRRLTGEFLRRYGAG